MDADELRRQFIEQRRVELQMKRQETVEKERQERLDKCVAILRDKGGAVSRKQLTAILINVFGRERSTVSSYISGWLKEGVLAETEGMIQVSNNSDTPF